MLTYLIDYLQSLQVPGINAFSYVTTRSGIAFVLALLLATIVGKKIIARLQLLQLGEIIRPLDLEGEKSKAGTPSMGGIIIIVSLLIPVLLFAKLNNVYIILMILTTLWLGVLGFIDDYIKLVKKNKEGLRGRYKIIAQVGLGTIVAVVLFMSPSVVILENHEVRHQETQEITVTYNLVPEKSTTTTIPFVKENNFDYSWFVSGFNRHKEMLTFLIFIIACIFIVTAVSNGANMTDGLDGLAAGSSAFMGMALGILAYVSSHLTFAEYLNVMFIPGAEELVVFAASFVGATMGFLWYNSYPAQVFMGDTGSLTIGGIIAVYAIVIRKELLLPILCGIFVVENLSVILQRYYYKYTKKKQGVGKRIFKMAPLHHHFQKPGNEGIDAIIQKPITPIPEAKIVTRFWLIGAILAILTIITLKLR